MAENTVENKAEEMTELDKKIIRQVEYYFGDINLPKDKFMKEKVKEDDGWITVECLTTFNRLKQLSTDFEEICKALKKSDSGLLEINDTDFKIRRSKDKPVPDLEDPMVIKAKKMKTLYLKGFPKDYSMDQVSDFLREHGAESVFIKMRKTDDFKFKGSIFTELHTQEQADALLEKKDLKIGEEEVMLIMKREDYFEKKHLERRGKNKEDQQERIKIDRKEGAVIHFKNVEEGLPREDVKAIFQPHQNIEWIDFKRGDTEGYIRFEEENTAQKAIDAVKEANDGKIMLKEKELEVRVLEGEDAENYWKMTEELRSQSKRSNRGGRGGRGGRQGGRGGLGGRQNRYGSRKRSRDNNDENQNSEDKKVEPKGDHIRFDDGESETKKAKTEEGASPAKKAKVETAGAEE